MEVKGAERILYRIVWALLYVVSLLPLRVLYALSDVAYLVVSSFYRRKLVRQQLTECFPEKSLEEIKEIERRFYHQFCDQIVEMVKELSIGHDEMMRRMKFVDGDLIFDAAHSEHPIAFLMLGHFGNWEWIVSLPYWAGDIHCCQVYHPLTDDVLDTLFLNMRNRFGGECIKMRQTVRRLIQLNAAHQPTICGMIADQQPRWDAIHHFTPFLGHDTAVFIGTEEVAKKINATVFYGSVRRVRRGYYECKVIPITLHPNELPDYQITDRYMQLLEADIRQHPELWLWTHKRWTRTKEEWKERQA